jgi:molybdenum cofactor cytidylyltransferase
MHKLQALLAGKPVLQHTLDAVRASGLPWHLEDAGHSGMGDSIAAAVRATIDAGSWLVLPGDLPLIRPHTLQAVAQALSRAEVVVPVLAGIPPALAERGHPVGFSAACRAALLALCGDRGAAAVLRQYRVTELAVDDPGVVADVDTVADLERLTRWAKDLDAATGG